MNKISDNSKKIIEEIIVGRGDEWGHPDDYVLCIWPSGAIYWLKEMDVSEEELVLCSKFQYEQIAKGIVWAI